MPYAVAWDRVTPHRRPSDEGKATARGRRLTFFAIGAGAHRHRGARDLWVWRARGLLWWRQASRLSIERGEGAHDPYPWDHCAWEVVAPLSRGRGGSRREGFEDR
jgi:hypothetical protein